MNSATDATAAHAHHPPYMRIFYWLAGLTAVEIALPFVLHASKAILVTLLILIAIWKMLLILRFFMHLKFDALVLSIVAATPAILASILAIGLLLDFV
jgi:cytochrome c oxidase subunit 4